VVEHCFQTEEVVPLLMHIQATIAAILAARKVRHLVHACCCDFCAQASNTPSLPTHIP
jgi:hypothetical protein